MYKPFTLSPALPSSAMIDRRHSRPGVGRFSGDGRREGFRSDRAIYAGGDRKWGEDGDGKGKLGLEKGFIQHSEMLEKQRGVSSRLLTLPTVLTLGRVAAVPLLVSRCPVVLVLLLVAM